MGNLDSYTLQKPDRFTFGLWTIENPGAGPFGGAVRTPVTPPLPYEKLGQLVYELLIGLR